jgi:hypothetical protein
VLESVAFAGDANSLIAHDHAVEYRVQIMPLECWSASFEVLPHNRYEDFHLIRRDLRFCTSLRRCPCKCGVRAISFVFSLGQGSLERWVGQIRDAGLDRSVKPSQPTFGIVAPSLNCIDPADVLARSSLLSLHQVSQE